MNKKTLIGLIAVVGLAALAFFGGQQLQNKSKDDRTADAGGSTVSAPKIEGNVTKPDDAVHSALHYEHFRVGSRNVKAMMPDGDTVWIGTSGGVIRYDTLKDDYKLYDNKSGLLSNGVFHLSKVDGKIWVGTYGGGLSILDPAAETWSHYNVPEGMGDAFIYDALVTKAGDIWFATWSGANRIPKGGKLDDINTWELHTVENTNGGLPNDWVYGLAEGSDGEVWIATEGGLARYKDGKWDNWGHKDGLGARYDIVEKDIEFKQDPGQQSSHHATQKQEQGLSNVDVAYNPNYVIALHVDAEGKVWAGTWGAGLSVFDGKNWNTLTKKDGLPSNHVFMLKGGPDGNLYVGTSEGLSRYDGKKFVQYTERDGLFSNAVFSLAFADNGAVWVGSFGGVSRFFEGLKHAEGQQPVGPPPSTE